MKSPTTLPSLSTSSHSRLFRLPCVLFLLLSAAVATQAAPRVLQVSASGTNTSGAMTTLDHPAINGKPNLRMVLTQYSTGILNNHPVGFFYDTILRKWKIANEDGQDIPLGSNFNILLPRKDATVHAGSQNSADCWTYFNTQKGNQKAILLASHVITPFSRLFGNGVNLGKNIGLSYIGETNRPQPGTGVWSVYNEDQSSPLATAYTIADVTREPHAFVLTSVVSVDTPLYITIDHPVANNNPNAVIFVSHVFNPLGAAENWYDHTVSVTYDGSHWHIMNQDQTPMVSGITFNVCIYPETTP